MDPRATTLLVGFLSVPFVVTNAAAPTKGAKGWTVSRGADEITVSRRSDLVNYTGKNENELIVSCDTRSHALGARMRTQVKTFGPFLVRFDTDPARQLGTSEPHHWASGFELIVPAPAVQTFIADARARRQLLLRHDFGGRMYDVHFDLTGLDAALHAFEGTCELPAPTAEAASTSQPRAASAPRQRQIGRWSVLEKTSTIDDKPIVIVTSASADRAVTLYLRCQESAVEAYFVGNKSVFNGDPKTKTVAIEVGLDGGQGTKYAGPTTELFKAVFIPDGRTFVDSLAGHRSLELTYPPWKAAPKLAKIDLTGTQAALVPLQKACPSQPQP